MLSLIKSIIWIVGTVVVAHFILGYFGYQINFNYFQESKAGCEEKLNQCGKNLVRQGTENVKCNFQCVDPKLIIKRK